MGHVDLRRLDAAAVVKLLGEVAPPTSDPEVAKQLRADRAGGQASLNGLWRRRASATCTPWSAWPTCRKEPVFLVAPRQGRAADRQAGRGNSCEMSRLPARAAMHGNAAVAGTRGVLARLKTLQAAPRPDLAKAFALAGDTAAAVRVLAHATTRRRVLREMLPRLPDEIGGGSGKMLADGVQWAVLSSTRRPSCR